VEVKLTRAGRKRLERLRRGTATLKVSVAQGGEVTRTAAKVALRRR
jgi:hypothetical protein